jgi:L-fuculose-phosphate aldolase
MVEYACERERERRADLIRFGRLLARLGFTPGTSGNLFVRLDENRILATPTGMSKCFFRASDIVIVDRMGRQLQGAGE